MTLPRLLAAETLPLAQSPIDLLTVGHWKREASQFMRQNAAVLQKRHIPATGWQTFAKLAEERQKLA